MSRYALLIGINNYRDDNIPALKYAERDAEVFAQVLEERLDFKTFCLLGKNASRENVLKALRIRSTGFNISEMSPSDQFLFFFSGHGELVGEEKAYVLHPYDAEPDHGFPADCAKNQGPDPGSRHGGCFQTGDVSRIPGAGSPGNTRQTPCT